MALSPRALAHRGVGFGPRVLAHAGWWPVDAPARRPAPEGGGGGGARRRYDEQFQDRYTLGARPRRRTHGVERDDWGALDAPAARSTAPWKIVALGRSPFVLRPYIERVRKAPASAPSAAPFEDDEEAMALLLAAVLMFED